MNSKRELMQLLAVGSALEALTNPAFYGPVRGTIDHDPHLPQKLGPGKTRIRKRKQVKKSRKANRRRK